MIIFIHKWDFTFWDSTKDKTLYVYYQLCPSCKEPVVGIYESQKLELMPPVTPDDINNKVSVLKKNKNDSM